MIKEILMKRLGLNKTQPSTEAEFDVEGLDVFAVEREADGHTLFTYYNSEGNQHDFFCITTDEQHRAFVARLTAKITSRETAKKIASVLSDNPGQDKENSNE